MSPQRIFTSNSMKIFKNFWDHSFLRNVSSTVFNTNRPISVENDRLNFDKTYPNVVKKLMNNKRFERLNEIKERLERSMNYNVPKGKRNRGLALVQSYKLLENPEELTENNIELANILGWTVEILQAFFLVMDDITDGSEKRRGQLCWYKQPDIGLTAINDGLILERVIYMILDEYFNQHPCYLNFVKLFNDVTLLTCIGQVLDNNTPKNVLEMNLKRVELIAVNKTAYYSFYLPISLALYLSKRTDENTHGIIEKIALEIGKFFQIQDDYLDCFGDPKLTGKLGTDIETAKCTWLAALAVEKISKSNNKVQREIMEKNYGKDCAECVENVKKLYLELGIPALYEEHEKKSFENIKNLMKELPEDIPNELFDKIVASIYRRNS